MPTFGKWLDISEAPKEEYIHTVLLARNHGKCSVMPGFFDGENWQSVSIIGSMIYVDPTHFMFLPAPPNIEG